MNNEQDKPLNDARVRDAYRALATEKAPEALNQRVLKSAAEETSQAGRTRLEKRLWMKPVAWAAIIGLCLAIALEVTRMSEVYELDGVILPVEPAAAPQQPESKARSDNAVTERPTLPTEVLQKPARQSYELPAAVAEEELQRARPADPTPGKLSAPRPAATLQQDTAERTPAATAFKAELESPTDPTPACDATARQSAAAWRACIEELRDAGLLQAATSEYEAFALEYPKIAAEFRPDK